jgi:hypothetical protein
MTKLGDLGDDARKHMDTGDFEGAKNVVQKLLSLGQDYVALFMASGLMIDIGSAVEDEQMIEEGIILLKKNFKTIFKDNNYAPKAYYNLANGYYCLFQFKLKNDPYSTLFRDTELDIAKIYFRKALEYDVQDSFFTSEILVNLGNCFDERGRVIDALECYEQAIQLKPDHGMALGNKAIALAYYARIAGKYQKTFLIDAHSLLVEALRSEIPSESIEKFSIELERIQRILSDEDLKSTAKYPGYSVETENEAERSLIEFCIKYKLYLNICNFCQKCNAAIGDTITLGPMILPLKDNTYLRLSSYLNQIKQDYTTARFLLFLSTTNKVDLEFADKHVMIVDTLDQSIHNINVQLLKTSFKMLYDVLDKIAYFFNDYLQLGISETKVDFRRVWYSNSKKVNISQKVMDSKNLSLNAMFDIYRDFEEGPYIELREIRHASTHRFLNIRQSQQAENTENMTKETLVERTLHLARIVRNTIIYLIYFVDSQEVRKNP